MTEREQHEGSTHRESMQQGSEMRCPMCGAEFRSQSELEQHKKQAHPTK